MNAAIAARRHVRMDDIVAVSRRELARLADSADDVGLCLIPCRDKRPIEPWARRFAAGRFYSSDELLSALRSGRCDAFLISTHHSNLVVVDADNAASVRWFRDVLARRGIKTLMVETGRGAHFYFRRPSRDLVPYIKSAVKIVDRDGIVIDIRADRNGVVVAPMSLHKSGKLYRPSVWPWSELTLAELPVFDPAMFGDEAAQRLTTDRRSTLTDDEAERLDALVEHVPEIERVRQARAWLAEQPERVAKGTRDNTLFVLACALLRGFALPQNVALELLETYNVAACDPPMHPWEVRAKIDSARRSGSEPIGGRLVDASSGLRLEQLISADSDNGDNARSTMPPEVRTSVWQRASLRLRVWHRLAEIKAAERCEACYDIRFHATDDGAHTALCDACADEARRLEALLPVLGCCLARIRVLNPETGELPDDSRLHAACERVYCAFCSHKRAHAWRELFLDTYGDVEFVVASIATPGNTHADDLDAMRTAHARIRDAARGARGYIIRGRDGVFAVAPIEYERAIRMRARGVDGVEVEILNAEQVADRVAAAYVSWSLPVAAAIRLVDLDRLRAISSIGERIVRITPIGRPRQHVILADWPTMIDVREQLTGPGEAERNVYEVSEVQTGDVLGITPPVPHWRARQFAFRWLDMRHQARVARERLAARNGPSEQYRRWLALEKVRLELRRAKIRAAGPALAALRAKIGNAAYRVVTGDELHE